MYKPYIVHDCRIPPRGRWNLRSSGTLCSAAW